jgi:hypothetical protein
MRRSKPKDAFDHRPGATNQFDPLAIHPGGDIGAAAGIGLKSLELDLAQAL